ncbi:hypothetical protein F4803DRAFT_556590 [Xylaria telfairii]|nr:hypothetical protein F4803DRAFT_556590 [Xylaria telfairii]
MLPPIIIHIGGLKGIDPQESPFDSRLSSVTDFFPNAQTMSFSWCFDNHDEIAGSYLQAVAKDAIDNVLMQKDKSQGGLDGELEDESMDGSEAESPPRAVIFLADYTGITLVKQILLLALETPDYQWIAFGAYVLGSHLRESHTDSSKYFFGLESVNGNVTRREYLAWVRGSLGRELHGHDEYEHATALYDALLTAQQEFLPLSSAFNPICFDDGHGADGHISIHPKEKGTSLSTGPEDNLF